VSTTSLITILPVDRSLVGDQVDHAVGEHHVDTRIFDRQPFEVTLAKLDVREAGLLRVGPCLGEHLVGHVDADHASGGPDRARGQEGIEAGARSQVEHDLARLQGGHGERRAAPHAEVGALRNRRGVGRRIADSLCDLPRLRAAATHDGIHAAVACHLCVTLAYELTDIFWLCRWWNRHTVPLSLVVRSGVSAGSTTG
jgi:hypothetical protein